MGSLVYEFVTSRFSGHSVSDPGTSYRIRDQVQQVRASEDPLDTHRHQVIKESSIFDTDELKEFEQKIKTMVNEEVAEAEKKIPPQPVPEVLFEDSYVRDSEPEICQRTDVC